MNEREAYEDAIDEIRDELRNFGRELGVLRSAFEVHIAAETEYRLRIMERLENVRLSIDNAALKTSMETAQRFESRLTHVENEAKQHIRSCEDSSKERKAQQHIRTNHIYALWVSLIILAITVLFDYLKK